MEISDLTPSIDLLHNDESSTEFLKLMLAQISHLERKSEGLLSGKVIVSNFDHCVNYQISVTVPKISNFEVILFNVARITHPDMDVDEQSVEKVRNHFSSLRVLNLLKNVYTLARSVPIPKSPYAEFNGSGYSDDPDD
jgi:uncharacterized membrane protein